MNDGVSMIVVACIVGLLGLGLTGCTPETPDKAMYTHQCTSEQMVKVEAETKFCKNETGYSDTHCYGSAIMRNCEPKAAAAAVPVVMP